MSDYTPGHALDDILAAFGRPAETRAQLTKLREATTRLYKAGQANERAAIVAMLRAEAEDARKSRDWDHVDAYERSAALIERAS